MTYDSEKIKERVYEKRKRFLLTVSAILLLI